MNYESLIKSISLIVENDEIDKTGLTMTYSLPEQDHINLSVDLYYKTNQQDDFKPEDEFEVTIGGILVKFVKKI